MIARADQCVPGAGTSARRASARRRAWPAALACGVVLVAGLASPATASPAAGSPAVVHAASSAASLQAPVEAQVTVMLGEIDLSGPAIRPMTVTISNGSAKAMSKMVATLTGPVGWTISPSQALDGQLRPGQSREVTFLVQVPQQRDGFRTYDFRATLNYRGGDGLGSAAGTRSMHSGQVHDRLSSAFNNVGVTDESATTAGQFDSEGNSFSAQKLADVGLTSGAAVSALGATFTWPAAAPGTPGNVAAAGQAVALPGQGSRIAFLGSGSSTAAVGNVTVYYTDGTSSIGSVGFPNWSFHDASAYGATLVASSMGRNRPDGYGDAAYAYRVFANAIEVDPTKTVDFVVLPGNASVHLFDMVLVP